MIWLTETLHNNLKHQTSCIIPSVKVHRGLRIKSSTHGKFPFLLPVTGADLSSGSKRNKPASSSGPPESTSHWHTYCQFRWSPVFLNEHVSICILTYDWERVCLNVCLCACHTNHSCVKMTVGDSWGPWTEHRWRSEIRYVHLLYLHCTLTFFSTFSQTAELHALVNTLSSFVSESEPHKDFICPWVVDTLRIITLSEKKNHTNIRLWIW